MKKRGRPKTEADVRDNRIVFYLTGEDAEALTRYAAKLQFKSRSEFCTAVIERLLIGGLAPAVFHKVGMQLAKRAEKLGVRDGAGFYFGVRPLPPLPDVAIPAKDYQPIIEEVEREIERDGGPEPETA